MNLLSDAWLEQRLADGPHRAAEVTADAEAAGFGRAALSGARRRLGVLHHRCGFGPGSYVTWHLPGDKPHTHHH